MDALEDRVYGCDICQDVCPGTAGSRSAAPASRCRATRSRRSRSSTGSSATATSSIEELDRLFVPRNDPRWLRRNALVALGNTGRPGDERAASRSSTTPSRARPDGAARLSRGCGRPRVTRRRPARGGRARAAEPGRCARGACRGRSRRRLPRSGGGSSSSPSPPAATSSGSSRTPSSSSLATRARRPRRACARARLGARRGRPSTGSPRATADPTRLRQALANLVANGLRHGSTRRDRRGGAATAGSWSTWPTTGPGVDPTARSVRARRERCGLDRDRALARARDRRGARWLARARRPRAGRALQARPAVRFRRAG